MPVSYLSPEEKRDTLRALTEARGNKAEAARILGINYTTYKNRLQRLEKAEPAKPFSVTPIPTEELSHEELLEWRKRQFDQKRKHKEAAKLRDVKIKIRGPIGITHFGDPHVDDDGTDIGLLERHMDIVNATEGMFGANLGDLQNNWIGRLARLWAEQGTSAKQAWQLTEWMCRKVEWLYLVGGNHDAWSGTGDPLKWIMAQANTVFEYSGVRIKFAVPQQQKRADQRASRLLRT